MSLDVWQSALIKEKKKGQGRIGLALLDDGLLKQPDIEMAIVYRLPPWIVFLVFLLISLFDN